jgi:DNA (cytosine-5)-methyltransferase 1
MIPLINVDDGVQNSPEERCVVKPRLLDLFCCAGGAGMGYHRAGFEVVGVDIDPQPNYPFEFHQGDAIEYVLRHWREFDVIHASPPCQDHSVTRHRTGKDNGSAWLLDGTRTALNGTGLPWVIENVPGASMRADFKLCGCMFDLPGLRRERWFETSWGGYEMRPPCYHTGKTITVAGHPGGTSARDGKAGSGSTADWRRAMGIDWTTARELAQAIPPAYTEHIGAQLLEHMTKQVA